MGDCLIKTADEDLPFSIACGDWFDTGESLSRAAVVWRVTGVGPDDVGLTIDTVDRTDDVIRARVRGGQPGARYFVSLRVVSTAGRRLSHGILIQLRAPCAEAPTPATGA